MHLTMKQTQSPPLQSDCGRAQSQASMHGVVLILSHGNDLTTRCYTWGQGELKANPVTSQLSYRGVS